MPNVHEMFPSRFLRADELDRPVHVVVDRVEAETVNRNGREERVWVIYFKNAKKGVVLSRRTALQIARALGSPRTEDWVGKEIIVCADTIRLFGESRRVISFMKPLGKKEDSHG